MKNYLAEQVHLYLTLLQRRKETIKWKKLYYLDKKIAGRTKPFISNTRYKMEIPNVFSYLSAFCNCPYATELKTEWFIDNMVKCYVSSCCMWTLVNCSADMNSKSSPFQFIVRKHMFSTRVAKLPGCSQSALLLAILKFLLTIKYLNSVTITPVPYIKLYHGIPFRSFLGEKERRVNESIPFKILKMTREGVEGCFIPWGSWRRENKRTLLRCFIIHSPAWSSGGALGKTTLS